jgi:hypothetical protein
MSHDYYEAGRYHHKAFFSLIKAEEMRSTRGGEKKIEGDERRRR